MLRKVATIEDQVKRYQVSFKESNGGNLDISADEPVDHCGGAGTCGLESDLNAAAHTKTITYCNWGHQRNLRFLLCSGTICQCASIFPGHGRPYKCSVKH